MTLPVESKGVVELDHGLSGQITSWQHLQSLNQLHHGVIILVVRKGQMMSHLSLFATEKYAGIISDSAVYASVSPN